MSDPVVKCDGCDEVARRRPGFMCPDFWYYLTSANRRSIYVALSCSDACRDRMWLEGPGTVVTGRCIVCKRRPGSNGFRIESRDQTTQDLLVLWVCSENCRAAAWKRGPGPAGKIKDDPQGSGKPSPIGRPLVCGEHGRTAWKGHIACAACGRGYQTQDPTRPRFAPEACECGARLAPGGDKDFSARPICEYCFNLLATFSSVRRNGMPN